MLVGAPEKLPPLASKVRVIPGGVLEVAEKITVLVYLPEIKSLLNLAPKFTLCWLEPAVSVMAICLSSSELFNVGMGLKLVSLPSEYPQVLSWNCSLVFSVVMESIFLVESLVFIRLLLLVGVFIDNV